MDVLLQLLGSIASLLSVPLAIYLYLRSREIQFRRVRQEIARNLSYQIGEGRELSTFEIQAVIDSQSRESRIRRGRIPRDDIIEDLVSDTIRNPMIPSSRKQEIIENLQHVHGRPLITMREITEDEAVDTHRRQSYQKIALPFLLQASTIFPLLALILLSTFVGVVYVFFHDFWVESNAWPIGKQLIFAGLVGGLTSLVAGLLSLGSRFIYQYFRKRPRL